MKRKRSWRFLFLFVLFCFTIPVVGGIGVQKVKADSQLKNGSYVIPVTLWKAGQDQVSMGNASLEEAKLEVKDGKGTLYLKFKAMEFSGMEGYLSQIDLLKNISFDSKNQPQTFELESSKVVSTFSVVDDYNSSSSTDANTAGKLYPKVVSMSLTVGDDLLWTRVYVPIMGSLGFGEQFCRIKLDYDQATEMTSEDEERWSEYEKSDSSNDSTTEEDSSTTVDRSKLKTQIDKATALKSKTDTYTEASLKKLSEVLSEANRIYKLSSVTQTVIDNQVTLLKTAISKLVKKSEETLDKDNLADGKYTVYVDLWNATSDQESMGNLALNKKTLLTVKNGVYTMELSTRPMTVGTITACLQTIQIKQKDGTYVYAKITANNNENNQPSIFQFTLPSKEEYLDVLIDPKVAVMGDDPLEARLKISWDTLTKVSDDETVEENTETVVSGNASDAINWTHKKTGIKIKAEANIVENGATYKITSLSSGSKYRSVAKLFTDVTIKNVYQIKFYNKKGKSIQPGGMVQISIPVSSKSSQSTLAVYRVLDGVKTKMSGTLKNNYYTFSTNKIGYFVVVDESQTTSSILSSGTSTSGSSSSSSSSSISSSPLFNVGNTFSNSAAQQAIENAGAEEEEVQEDAEEVEEGVEEIQEEGSLANSEESQEIEVEQAEEQFGRVITLVMLGISMVMSFVFVILVFIIGIRQMKKKG